jgi:hypothetical protein
MKPVLKQRIVYIAVLVFILLQIPAESAAKRRPMKPETKAKLIARIINEYPNQFSNPEKKHRKTFSQFGYGLSEFTVPVFPITKFIAKDDYGYQNYGRPNRRLEKNGAIYTCRGGFIDFSHMREAIDWTVYLSLKILDNGKDLQLPQEAGTLTLRFMALDKLTREDLLNMAQKIAFERLVWHEVASWHYHRPYKLFSEQQSTFTPEDNYSNFLGTVIGRKVALRILNDTTGDLSYSQIASEEIHRVMTQLEPVETIRDSKKAYDIVDRNKQVKLPKAIRNNDVWYDSKIIFRDQRYMFKRNTNIGPEMGPWLVPHAEQAGCPTQIQPEVLHVPEFTEAGVSLYKYYEFTISPDSNLFYDYRRDTQRHAPFAKFSTQNFAAIIAHISKEMAVILMPGFDKRDKADPTVYYTNAKRVLFK